MKHNDCYILQHCALCQDGGKLWVCDEKDCECAICSACIEVPDEELSKLNDDDVEFTCVSCHWKKCRDKSLVYYVSALFVSFLFSAQKYLNFTGLHC